MSARERDPRTPWTRRQTKMTSHNDVIQGKTTYQNRRRSTAISKQCDSYTRIRLEAPRSEEICEYRVCTSPEIISFPNPRSGTNNESSTFTNAFDRSQSSRSCLHKHRHHSNPETPPLCQNQARVRRLPTSNPLRTSCHLWTTCVLVFVWMVASVSANVPPRFILDGQSEIVLRLREGNQTPVGSVIYRLRGYDPDGDTLQFAVRGQVGSRVLNVLPVSDTEADLVLKKELDRELEDEYNIVLTLTDGRLGEAFVTQSLLILVEDVNDNIPRFQPYEATITVAEDSPPKVLAVLQATDGDEGPFGQVVYRLEEEREDRTELFSVSTRDGQAVLRLEGKLDYERKPFYQLHVLAVDRAAVNAHTATAAVVIRVEDVEDSPPEFVVVPPVTRIPEDTPIGAEVMQVMAMDGDRGVNAGIEYALLDGGAAYNIDGDASAIFKMDPESGVVYVAAKLDREQRIETNGAYILKIGAREAGAQTNYVTTEATIILTDVNDEMPMFRAALYTAEISEAAQRHLPVTLLGNARPQVFDYDQGTNGTFRMYLEGDGDIFEVTPPEGVNEATFLIRVKDPSQLDYEKVRQLNFTIVAEEVTSQGPPKQSQAQVVVYVRDANDNAPEFAEERYVASIPEDVRRGFHVAWIQALDPDSGPFGTEGIRFTEITGDIADVLHLDPISGKITMATDNHGLDRETQQRHQLMVEARDTNGRGNGNRVPLEIVLTDVNDNPPRCTQRLYTVSVPENVLRLTEIPMLEAVDDDQQGTPNAQLQFRIIDGDPQRNFSIDGVTGRLQLQRPLDFEALYRDSGDTRAINLTIQVTDKGEPPLSSTCTIQVLVLDVNDVKPHFDRSVYVKSVPEDAPAGTRITQVSAFDGDGSRQFNKVVYRIQGGAQDKFVIDSTTGVITVAQGASLDPDLSRPRAENYELIVSALDGGVGADQLTDVTTVNVTVQDVNNKRPSFIDPGEVQIPENTRVGSEVSRVRATDLDAVPLLRYSIDHSLGEARNEEGTLVRASDYNYTAAFQIHPIEGVIRTARTLDRERVETIRLVLRVEDLAAMNSRQTATTTLTVHLEDVNDHSPVFRQPYYRRSAMENSKPGTPIVNVVAEDVDVNKSISYSLRGPPDILDLVFLDEETGEIVVGKRIDRERTDWLNFTVRATDSGVPSRSSHADIYVQVLDENDNNPQFVDTESVVTLREDAPVGSLVVQVEARDIDSGDYGKLTYRLDRRSSAGKFQVDADSGKITVLSKLDREEQSVYTLIVEVWDNYQFGFSSGESRNAFKQIRVEISDVNDEFPVLHLPKACVTVTEFHDPRDVITLVTADDADDVTTPNGRIRFSIVGGNSDGLFTLRAIDENSANLFATRRLVGYYGNYTVTVLAEDGGYPPNSAKGAMSICVSDFNDHAPRFTQPPANFSIRIPENATLGSSVITVHAEDADIGINGAVRYRLRQDPLGNYHTFEVDDVTGEIVLRRPLDRERQKVYEIRVEAYDLGIPTALSSDLDLTVFVRDVNDFQPQFLVDSFSINFTEHRPPGAERRRVVETVDRDEPDDDDISKAPPVCCFIVGGNDGGFFTLDPVRHEIMAIKELDREETSEFVLIIKATEDCQERPPDEPFFRSDDDSLLKVIIYVNDINDNLPKFVRPLFTGGVTTEADYGAEVITIQAIDLDQGPNADLRYYIKGPIQRTLSEGLETIGDIPFLLNDKTGVVILNFDPQKGMKGYFDFVVQVMDRSGKGDKARVFIYLLREDQRIKFVLRMQPQEARRRIDYLRDYLGNVSNAIVNVDEFKVHETPTGAVDRTKTDLYLHFVDRRDHSILEVDRALGLLDKNVEILDPLFKEFNVLSTREAGTSPIQSDPRRAALSWLIGVCAFLLLLLATVLGACLSQRARYRRMLRAATATAFGSPSATVSRSSAVPNTNVHAVEGSNPVWTGAFDNEYFKPDADNGPPSSRLYVEGDSLDENAFTGDSLTLTAQQQQDLFTQQRSSARSSVNYNHPENTSKLTTNDLGKYQQNILSQSHQLSPRGKYVETTEL